MKIFRKYGFRIATGTIFAGVGLSFLPEVAFPEKLKLFYAYHVVENEKRVALPLTVELRDMLDSEMRKCGYTAQVEAFFTPIVPTSIFDTLFTPLVPPTVIEVSKGSLKNSKGGVIGLPFYFKFLPERDFEVLKRYLCYEGIEEETANRLTGNLLLSDDAKRFYISRELHRLSFESFYWKVAFLTAGAASGSFLYHTCGLSLNLRANRFVTFIIGSTCAALAFATFVSLLGLKNHKVAREADKKCLEMGPNYVAGGSEFYTKTIGKNRTLRLCGFSDHFSPVGSERYRFGLHPDSIARFENFRDYRQSKTIVPGP